ncbi:MAG: cytochrome c3 family protein [Vicinamibacterales bacterium]
MVTRDGTRLWLVVPVAAVWLVMGAAATEAGQLGALVSPGRLSQPHASLEGIRNCTTCHEAGAGVTGAKCLACHQPIAERIRARRGVHRDVQGGDCVTCHAEHQGASGELRPFDTSRFDHARDAGYPLDGRHASLATNCAACHTTRSYLAVRTACASCHQDTHRGTLGARCESCHTTRVAFREGRQAFDHSKAAFPLAGAHERVACESCHKKQQYKGIAFATCTACHADPHSPKATAACTSCHAPTATSWRSRRFDHAATRFPLAGRHQAVACVECHVRPALQVTPRFDTCAACHADPHRGAFRQDCKSCHDEQSFTKAPFDHTTTAFPLTGKHAPATCVACHKNLARVAQRTGRPTRPATVEFGGLRSACASCHDDVHAADLGAACETCHSTERFAVTTYGHRRDGPFFAGAHAPATCEACHLSTAPVPMAALALTRVPRPRTSGPAAALAGSTPVHGPLAGVKLSAAGRACATCHADAHLGQVGTACETCHGVEAAKFAVTAGFDHARSTFALGGKHAAVPCAKCHRAETGVFPAGTGTATRLTGLATACAACHTDVHRGRLGARCETCHTDQTFALTAYTHQNPAQRTFFVGAHARATCASCHTVAGGDSPAGAGAAVRYAITTECTSCHRDVHNGALGPRCADCHRLDRSARLMPVSDPGPARRAAR